MSPQNAGGFAALVEIEELDGRKRKFLLDSGWSYKWMDECFKREGIDQMLKNKEIEALIISHEHFDHYWGVPVTYKYDPTITTYIPDGFYPEGLQYLKDAGHKGKVIKVKPGLNPIIPGLATFVFAVPIICRVYGEQALYVNVKDHGLVSITGCCHFGIIQFAETAFREIKYEKDQLYGIYGGLHISPFEDWDPKYDDLVLSLGKYGFQKIGCNHCTGVLCAKKFIEAGYPVQKGYGPAPIEGSGLPGQRGQDRVRDRGLKDVDHQRREADGLPPLRFKGRCDDGKILLRHGRLVIATFWLVGILGCPGPSVTPEMKDVIDNFTDRAQRETVLNKYGAPGVVPRGADGSATCPNP